MEKIMISTVSFDLEYCYGINKMRFDFEFAESRKVYCLYAPNGVMKTSFADTLKDFKNDKGAADEHYPDRNSKRVIVDNDGNDISSDTFVIVEPYDPEYKSENVSTLLANRAIRDQYQAIRKSIDELEKRLSKALKARSGIDNKLNANLTDLSVAFGNKTILEILEEIEEAVANEEGSEFIDIEVRKIFNPKVEKFLQRDDIVELIIDYTERFAELKQESRFLRDDFTPTQMRKVQESLATNKFFEAQHSINLFDGRRDLPKITSPDEFRAVIDDEWKTILGDPRILANVELMESLITNSELRELKDVVQMHPTVIRELSNLPAFRKKLWIGYLIEQKDLFLAILSEYRVNRTELERISTEAQKETELWKEVIKEFQDRFRPPFNVFVGNQEDVVLKNRLPSFEFSFCDGAGGPPISKDRTSLVRRLSQGEKKSLYILELIFEFRARKEMGVDTIFVVDDLAESFDYRNKYAIVQYLKDISKVANFYLIILTHNFDFHRTIKSRFHLNGDNDCACVSVNRFPATIDLRTDGYALNPFKAWLPQLGENNSKLISYAFLVRNLADYCVPEETVDDLHKLLHHKPDSNTFTVQELVDCYKLVLQNLGEVAHPTPDKPVVELLFEEADLIAAEEAHWCELEKKLVLALAIRINLEKHMVQKLTEKPMQNFDWNGIGKRQTGKLLKWYKRELPVNKEFDELADQMQLMTAQEIHLNSFMYEPILDISGRHLKDLYARTKLLV